MTTGPPVCRSCEEEYLLKEFDHEPYNHGLCDDCANKTLEAIYDQIAPTPEFKEFAPFTDDERRAVTQTAWYNRQDEWTKQHHDWIVRMDATVRERDKKIKSLEEKIERKQHFFKKREVEEMDVHMEVETKYKTQAEAAEKEVEKLEKENSALAANQCHEGIAGEHGHHLRGEVERANERIKELEEKTADPNWIRRLKNGSAFLKFMATQDLLSAQIDVLKDLLGKLSEDTLISYGMMVEVQEILKEKWV